MRITLPALALAALSLQSAGATRRVATPAAASAPAQCTVVQRYIDSVHSAGRFPGATVGIAFGNGTTCALAVGMSDTTRRLAMAPHDLLLSGSVGKTYVAAVALQLVGEGRLALDDPVSKFLGTEPWFGRLPNARDITVRMLLNHTSGLVRYEFDSAFVRDLRANPQKRWNPVDQIAYLFDRPAPFAAGRGWDYSDTNYLVLGLILERITGRPLNEEIRRRVLEPFDLRETRPSDSPAIPGLVNGYAGRDNEFGAFDETLVNGRFAINPQFEWAGGGYASSAYDLARWIKRYAEGGAFPASLVDSARAGVEAPMLGPGARYGLGLIIRPTPLGTSYGHAGFFPGYVTDARWFPDLGLAVAVQINTSVGSALGRTYATIVPEIARRAAGR